MDEILAINLNIVCDDVEDVEHFDGHDDCNW